MVKPNEIIEIWAKPEPNQGQIAISSFSRREYYYVAPYEMKWNAGLR